MKNEGKLTSSEERDDIEAFDLAMRDQRPNIPWAEVKKQLDLDD